jgi:hypothetical protein
MALVREHLSAGGVYYFNSTGSIDAQKTAMTVFPYGLRLFNFVAASDAPLDVDRDLLRRRLETYDVEGYRVSGAARITQLLEQVGQNKEDRDSILAHVGRVVTDDNMAVEFRDPFVLFEQP